MKRETLLVAYAGLIAFLYSTVIAMLVAYYFAYSPAFDWAAAATRRGDLQWSDAKLLLQVHDVVACFVIALTAFPMAMLIRRILAHARASVVVLGLLIGTSLMWGQHTPDLMGAGDPYPWSVWVNWSLGIGALPLAYMAVVRLSSGQSGAGGE